MSIERFVSYAESTHLTPFATVGSNASPTA
jgi:hypothetical protein